MQFRKRQRAGERGFLASSNLWTCSTFSSLPCAGILCFNGDFVTRPQLETGGHWCVLINGSAISPPKTMDCPDSSEKPEAASGVEELHVASVRVCQSVSQGPGPVPDTAALAGLREFSAPARLTEARWVTRASRLSALLHSHFRGAPRRTPAH